MPSGTEVVCALGCIDQLVGRSHACDFPPEVASVPVCTRVRLNAAADSASIDAQVNSSVQSGASIYELDAAQLRGARPDVILTQSQCALCAVSEAEVEKAVASLPAERPKIVSLSAARLAAVWSDIQRIADALGVSEEGRELLKGLKNRVVDVIEKTCLVTKKPSVACIEWIEPLMSAGNWIPELVDLAGGRDVFGIPGQHSPRLSWELLAKADPDVIVLMPCGFDLERTRVEAAALEKNPGWRKLRAVKSKNVVALDGSHYFNRPGPRLVDSLELLAEILHPKRFNYGRAKVASAVVA